MRFTILLALIAVAGCGPETPEDLDGSIHARGGICDLGAIARSLIGPAGSCPPKRVLVDTKAGSLERFEQASWSDDQACTLFELEGPGCDTACAPVRCVLDGDEVICDGRCSRERITCYILPESACSP